VDPDAELTETLPDNTLRLLFVCFHPQLSCEAQTALALRTLCGFSPAEIAAAFLSTEAAVTKRLVRARQRIRELGLAFEVPGPQELPERLDGVLGTLYLMFNEGYKASGGARLVREDLCHEAIRLALLIAQHPATRHPKAFALVALMLLNAARLSSRTDEEGMLLRLSEQDRSRWNQAMIHRGIQYLGMAACGTDVSEYHLEAGIAACHSTAPSDSGTNWARILGLYDQLVAKTRSPIAGLNRAVALSKISGPMAGLSALDELSPRPQLEGYYLYHAVRGALMIDAGRGVEAIPPLQRALELTTIPSERQFLQSLIAKANRR
jgi:RNA polymerase sigma-70 factor (ECF subfamily)